VIASMAIGSSCSACFADDGRTDIYALMFGRRTPYFCALIA
jgi:hypothetical protein